MEHFTPAELPKHTNVLMTLNIAYMRWVSDEAEKLWHISAQDALGMPIERYVEEALPKVVINQPHRAVFYVVFDGDLAVGMGGLRCLDKQTAEIKRIYVTPHKRGSGLGERIFTRLRGHRAVSGRGSTRAHASGLAVHGEIPALIQRATQCVANLQSSYGMKDCQ